MTETLLDQNHNPSLDDNKNWYEELVGENKKFKSNEDLAKGKAEADRFIEVLTREKAELRNDYLKLREEAATQAKLQDLIDRLEKNPNRNSDDSNIPPEDKRETPSYDPKEVQSLVQKTILETDKLKKETENFNFVHGKLREQFGNSVNNVLQERMNTLGLSDEDITSLAKKSPQAFFNTLGIQQQGQNDFQTPPRSSQRSDNFSPNAKKRTLSYYEELKKTNPRMYLDPKIAVQMDKDAQELGKDFFDTD